MDSLGKVSRVWVSLYEKFLGHSALLEGLCRLHMFGIPFYMRCQFVLFCCKNDIGQGSSNPALGRGECGTCKSGRCLAASFQYTWSLVPHSRGFEHQFLWILYKIRMLIKERNLTTICVDWAIILYVTLQNLIIQNTQFLLTHAQKINEIIVCV